MFPDQNEPFNSAEHKFVINIFGWHLGNMVFNINIRMQNLRYIY